MTPAVHRLSEGGESRVVNNWTRGIRRHPSMLPSYKSSTGWQKDWAKRAGEIWLAGRVSHTKKRR